MDFFPNPSSFTSKAAMIFFMSMGFISILVLLKLVIIPCASDFLLFTFPRLFVSARTSLSPAFVYVIVNFIIITIVASSNFQHKTVSASDPKHTTALSSAAADNDDFVTESDYAVPDLTPVHQSEPESQSNEPEEEEKSVLEDSVLSYDKSGNDPPPEKCANDYVSPDADDTLDATWKAIMEGQGKTNRPQLKKSDTCGGRIEKAEPFRNNEDEEDDGPEAWARKELKKSETFNDTASLQRDKSMTPEELNLRAEAFIQNFINQMRLQRLESEQRVMEMANRSA